MIFGSQLCLIELPNLTCVSSFWTKQSLSDLVSLSPCCDLRFYAGARKFLKRFLFGERHLFVAVSYPWKLTYYGRLNRCPLLKVDRNIEATLEIFPHLLGGCMELDLPYMPPKLAGWLHAWCRSYRLKKSTWGELDLAWWKSWEIRKENEIWRLVIGIHRYKNTW